MHAQVTRAPSTPLDARQRLGSPVSSIGNEREPYPKKHRLKLNIPLEN